MASIERSYSRKSENNAERKCNWIIPGGELPVLEERFGTSSVYPAPVTKEDFIPDPDSRRKNEKLIWEVD